MSDYGRDARFAKANLLAAEVDMANGAYEHDGVIDWAAAARAADVRKPSAETIKLAHRMLLTWRADR